jgi:hypothetical protein
VEIKLENKRHDLLRVDYIKATEWFKRNSTPNTLKNFRIMYRVALKYLETFPFRSHSLSTYHFFDKILNDDYFRYFKLGKNTSYCLFNYPKGKNYILACMSLNLNNLASSLQNRERTKEVA